ncbi:DUF6602 domain-containing protein [Bacillus mycoides]|uniref:DUF6602 domain-containing protein n=1 Tax=Bacillus mycoides TaxID=1405 RepID=UPI0011EBCC14|nr:DUF6602 domain-containing protein [Bacillus mycoides]QEL85894.1 hypothetical protein DN409_16525 [Bacillus mycoides]
MKKMYNFAYKTLENHIEKMMTEVQLIKQLRHNGEKGRESEGILKNFLIEMLPQRVAVRTGFVMDNVDNHSNQLDIIIYDSYFMPPVFQGYENSIIHIDSLDIVIETKLTYDNKKDIVLTSQRSANKVKNMALGEHATEEPVQFPSNPNYKEYIGYSEYFPYCKGELISRKPKKYPLCVLFAYTSKIKKIETVLKYLNDESELVNKTETLPIYPGLDIICILDIGLFVREKGKYVSFFDGKVENSELFSTLYYIMNNHIQMKERKNRDFISTWFNGLLKKNIEEKKHS